MIEKHFDKSSSNNQKSETNQQIISGKLTPSEYDAEFFKLNENHFKKLGITSIEFFRDAYGENPLSRETINDLVNSTKQISKIDLKLPIETETTTSTSTNLDYKKMSKTELAAIFNATKSKLVNNPKYNIVTFYDFQAFVLKYDNDVIQKMINECI